MDIGGIIKKLIDRSEDSGRSVLYVPFDLLSAESDYSGLVEAVKREGIVNQLGLVVDIVLSQVIDESHPRYASLKGLRDDLYETRAHGESPFYRDEDPVLTEKKKSRLEFNVERDSEGRSLEFELLKKWGIIGLLTPSKFKEVFDYEYEDRQAKTTGYSS